MDYKIIDQNIVSKSGARQWLIKVEGSFYIVSAVTVPRTGPETYIFPANGAGDVTDWGAVVELRGTFNPKEAIAELLEVLSEREDETEEDEGSNTISEYDALERFDDFLNEIHETVKCGVLEWDMSRVLKEMDPIAYQEGFNNWLNSEGLELE